MQKKSFSQKRRLQTRRYELVDSTRDGHQMFHYSELLVCFKYILILPIYK